MATTKADGLPFLPGNSFNDPTQTQYHVSNTLTLKNGFNYQKRPTMGLGGKRLVYNQLSESEVDELSKTVPTLTYGKAIQAPPESFVPAHLAFDKKVLRFFAYFKETVHESSQEYYRVRPIHIYYYLEDDSISVVEPEVENSGIPQGNLLRRQRVPKDDQGNTWHWRDFNIGEDVVFYGRSFHITNCDKFSSDFMESEGMVLNDPEATPPDPYMKSRYDPRPTYVTKSDFDQLKRFLTLDRQVLRFYCVWDDRDAMYGEMLPLILHYFLVDDTVEVLEVRKPNSGRDPFPVFMKRQKLPKTRDNVDPSFPLIALELSDHEIQDWFIESDFEIGKTVSLYRRRLLLYDCDEFTKKFDIHGESFFYSLDYKSYLRQMRGITDFTPIKVDGFPKEVPKMPLPPYNGYGSLEDSRQNCLSLVPHPPRKDVIKMLENANKILRYEAKLESKRPEDKGRRFIFSYRLFDDTISIFESHQRNSGIIGGKFLAASRIPKPGSDPEYPDYYGPGDLAIGAMVKVFKHRFIITNCDEYVWKMIQILPDHIPQETADSIRKLHEKK